MVSIKIPVLVENPCFGRIFTFCKLSEYEQLREDNIKRNKDFFQTLFDDTPTTNAAVVTANETTFTNETRTTINIDPVEVLLIC